MRNNILIIAAIFFFIMIIGTTSVFANAGDLLFKYKLGDYGSGTPAIGSDGTIYVSGSTFNWNIIGYNTTSDGLEYPIIETTNGDYGLMAFLSNGTLKWKLSLPRSGSSPAIDSNETIYTFVSLSTTVNDSTITYNSCVYAVNPDGTIKWTYETDPNVRIGSSFAIGTDNTIYFSVHDVYTGEPKLGELWEENCTLYALNPDGTLKWKYNTGKSVSIGSSPVIAEDGTIYLGVNDVFHAINPDGTLKWTYTVDPGFVAANGLFPNDIICTPAIDSDGTIYFGQRSFYFYALNPDGTLKWKYPTYNSSASFSSFYQSSPVIRPDGKINCFGEWCQYLTFNPDGSLNSMNKSLRWEVLDGTMVAAENNIVTTPAIDSEGTLYNGDFRNYYSHYTGDAVVSDDGYSGTSILSAIKPDGKIKWQFKTETGLIGSPIISSDGVLLAVDYHGILYAIETGTQTGPADSPWPMLGRNQYRTNNAGDTRVAKIGIRNTGGTGVKTIEIPEDFSIKGNFPNPFNPVTTIEFSIGKTEKTNLMIYNLTGQKVRELIADDMIEPGIHSVQWNGKDDTGKTVSSGIYIVRLKAGNQSSARTMMMLK